MPVTSQLISLEDFNGSPALTNYSGGSGATVNDDVIIEGTQSAGRRVDNATDKGFGATITAVDLSAAGQHIKVWLFVTQWASVTQVQIRISSGADDDHELPTGEYPLLGGFIPVWVDVSRTPEVGGTANEAAIGEIGVLLDIANVGGNASNLILDEIMHGTSGYLWDGAGGALSDFRIYETTNNEGVLITLNGVDFCYARLEIGSAAATTFTDSGFTLIFPDQSLVASTFMGLTCDIQNAGTDITLSNANIQSANIQSASRRPDFIVTGAAGTLELSSVNLLGMRTIDLTSSCTIVGGIFDTIALTQGAADISGAAIRTRSAAGVAAIDDGTFGSSGLRESAFEQADTGHAVELTATGSVTFDALTFSGYGADGTNSAAIYNNSGGAVTINIINGGDTPTVRNGAGASTTIVNAVSISLTGLVAGSRVYVRDTTNGVTLFNLIEPTTTFSGSVDYTGDVDLLVRVRNASGTPKYKPVEATGLLTNNGFTLNINQVLDE